MIYDRSYIDVEKARQIYTSKVQKFKTLTAEEQNYIDRAFFNLTALNRIAGKLAEIWDTLEGFGADPARCDEARAWAKTEFFKLDNFKSLIGNIAVAIAALSEFGVDVTSLTELYNQLTFAYTYTNLNNLEKLLYLIEDTIGNSTMQFAWQENDVLYVIGAHSVSKIGDEIYIE